MAKNRIQIINWRMHGADESYCSVGAFRSRDRKGLREQIENQIDPDYDWNQDTDAEEREDWDHVYYINDDITLVNGGMFEHGGKKFRITIREVK